MAAETVLITGASSGIGLELARLFAADKANLVLVARSEDKLNKVAAELRDRHGVKVRVVAKDLAQPTAPDEIFATLKSDAFRSMSLSTMPGLVRLANLPFLAQSGR